jgi:hypothetical protein
LADKSKFIALGLVLVTFQGARGFEVPDLNPFNPLAGTKPLSGVPDPRKKVQDVFPNCQQLTNAAQEVQEKANRVRTSIRRAATNLGSNDQKVLLYEFKGEAKFTYNAEKGTAWYEYIAPNGVKAEKGKVESSKDGNYSVPNMDARSIIRQTGFLEAKLADSKIYDNWANKKKRNQIDTFTLRRNVSLTLWLCQMSYRT